MNDETENCSECGLDPATEDNGRCFACDTIIGATNDEYARINDPFETGELVHTGSSD